jgi:hypothetical protein
MNDKLQTFYGQFEESAPEVYYNRKTKEYTMKQTGDMLVQDWVSISRADMVRQLALRGLDKHAAGAYLDTIQNNTTKSVNYVGPLGGYQKGFHRVGSFNALITDGPSIPKAIKGDWGYIRSIIDQLFGPRAIYIYSYMALSRRQLVNMLLRSMPAIIMVGPRKCGKSFFQSHIMTPFLGGRGVNISKNLTGEEKFTGLVYQNEHLLMGDHKLSCSTKDRRNLGSVLKELVATEDQVMRLMYVDPIPVTTFQRVTISLNDETENIRGLPPLDESLADKVMIFRVGEVNWPVEALTPEEVFAFQKAVEAQIPAFCWWLDNEFHIPEDLMREANGKPARFCLRHYHDPSIVQALTEVSPEYTLLEYIKQCFFTSPIEGSGTARTPCVPPSDMIKMTALEISQGLTGDSSPVKYNARELLNTGSRIGTLLERLHSKFPDHVYSKRTAKNRYWYIQDVDTVLCSGLLLEEGDKNGRD